MSSVGIMAADLNRLDADKVLHGNAADLYGFDLDYLAAAHTEITALAA